MAADENHILIGDNYRNIRGGRPRSGDGEEHAVGNLVEAVGGSLSCRRLR